MPILTARSWLSVIGWWEVAIGVTFLFHRTLRVAVALLLLQMAGTFMPLVILPEVTFQEGRFPFAPTLEGQYIIKNLLIISASQVFPMEPEFVTPQDGNTKQDCENEAAKRWIEEFGERCRKLGVTILGDDLYCHQPFCKLLLKKGLSFIFSCKPDSHKTLYEWVTELDGLNDVQTITVKRRHGKKRFIDTYRFVNQVPIRDGDDALMVNWCEITTATESDGKILYHNAFATNCEINNDNVAEIVEAGRTRWKIENENNNTLKTKGYHLTHNYGHGKQHLSSLLCSMIIMAFLFHTLLEIDDELYRLIRQKISRRDAFFNDVRALTGYFCFNSWHALFYFMLRGRERRFTLEELFDTS